MSKIIANIRPIRHEDVPGYWAALDSVAREERFITFTEAPEIARSAYFVASNIQKANPHWVAEVDGSIVGWCDVCRQSGFFSHTGILGIGITAEHRGQGLGRRLMSRAVADAWTKEFDRIELEVYASNLVAVALYEKLGFVFEGTRRNAARPPAGVTDVHIMAALAAEQT